MKDPVYQLVTGLVLSVASTIKTGFLADTLPAFEALEIVVRSIAGLAGLYFLFISIKHKRLQTRNESIRNRELEDR